MRARCSGSGDAVTLIAVLGDHHCEPLQVGIFLVLPPDRLDTFARWLFLRDEFAALGHLEAVEREMGLMAGYGIQLWPILQDIHQLRALYDQRAGTLLPNTGVLQAFGVNDQQSAQLISDLLD